jgi:hypothetical protein
MNSRFKLISILIQYIIFLILGEFIQKIDVPHPGLGESAVQKYPLTGISVLVACAGVGDLTAALKCHQKEHNVQIFERAEYQRRWQVYLMLHKHRKS